MLWENERTIFVRQLDVAGFVTFVFKALSETIELMSSVFMILALGKKNTSYQLLLISVDLKTLKPQLSNCLVI